MENLAFLAKDVPGFAVKGENIKVITEPSEFHAELCTRAENVKERAVFATLYLGTGPKEQTLIESVDKALQNNNGELKVKFLLDYSRGTRDVQGQSSCTKLLPLLMKYKESCKVSLYHTPDLRGVVKAVLPGKFNETIGVQHTKVCVFDNDVCISGANLSNDYFSQRQDRYILIKDVPKLAKYFEDLVDSISSFSFDLSGISGNNSEDFSYALNKPPESIHPHEGNYEEFIGSAHRRVNSFLNHQKSINKLAYDKQREVFLEVNNEAEEKSANGSDTWIFPSVQMGNLRIFQDEQLTSKFLDNTGKDPASRIVFGTGYFNLTDEYMSKIIHKSKAKFNIICAHPKANSFFNAPFPLYGVPYAYTFIANHFLNLCKKAGASSRIQMFEYQKPGWTFHGKGLWYYSSSFPNYPIATLIGSPNYGYRSVEKDLEAQVTIVSKNKRVQKALHHEQMQLLKSSAKVIDETFLSPERVVPRWVKLIVGTCRRFF